MHKLYIELSCIRDAQRFGIPQGYIEPNGMVVVWHGNGGSNNFVSLAYAVKAFPTLVLFGQMTDFS